MKRGGVEAPPQAGSDADESDRRKDADDGEPGGLEEHGTWRNHRRETRWRDTEKTVEKWRTRGKNTNDMCVFV